MSGEGSWASSLEGTLDGTGLRIVILCTRFHAEITDTLLRATRDTLVAHGVREDALEVIRVPGAWELPWIAGRVGEREGIDAIIALGCVVRGETPHFDFVAGEAARGLMEVSLGVDLPVILGLLTTETIEQARERADPARGNKGGEVALAAIEMARLARDVPGTEPS
ncbi:MAG: 6,7-dimethyl-8-ribityllumazine synthase [Longimicrobiales bacterium]|nr:6,7-dimethyl-8-ribityllumazine synthase [Longimicrobiales bacterium]